MNLLIREINNTQIDAAKDLDDVMLTSNLIEYSDKYSKRSVGLWQNCRYESNTTITDTESFKLKVRVKEKNLVMAMRKILKQLCY